jgi:vancomycin resistance protein YoaR
MAQGLSRVTHLENYETVGERSGSWEDEKYLRQKLKASSKTEEIQKARQMLRNQASAQRELKAKQREVLAEQQGKSKEEVQVMKVMNSMIDKLEKSADQEESMADLAARKAVRQISCVLVLRATEP